MEKEEKACHGRGASTMDQLHIHSSNSISTVPGSRMFKNDCRTQHRMLNTASPDHDVSHMPARPSQQCKCLAIICRIQPVQVLADDNTAVWYAKLPRPCAVRCLRRLCSGCHCGTVTVMERSKQSCRHTQSARPSSDSPMLTCCLLCSPPGSSTLARQRQNCTPYQ